MVTVIIQHEVKDFSEWEKTFDGDGPNLTKAGINLIGLYTKVNNHNDVTMIFEAPNAELFEKMMSDPGRQQDMMKAGVISIPTSAILNKV